MKYKSFKMLGWTVCLAPLPELSQRAKSNAIRILWYWIGTRKTGFQIHMGSMGVAIINNALFRRAHREALGEEVVEETRRITRYE